ncbi:hypothetical protein CK203_054783 [Vitis vinifera]|uniref:DUF659 domain-containing protein n=1 Tax=Vitis vinifera TaxID=29760 RepID=A0A438GIP4_VITVI|nr:hypothetical protein CK203_054783 [Vitis vinifera]
MNMGSEDVNEDLFGLKDEDFGEEINSRMNVTNISSGEMVVQNRKSGRMNQTTINDAYKKEARERACMLITRWMYEAAIPFNAVTYLSFQPMIKAIGQYGVGMKGPTLHEGTMFMQSIDAFSMIKMGEKMFGLLDKWVEQVGEENVIQVIADNYSSYVMTGRLLELKCPHLYWTPCVAHCLDLMLEDIGKLPNIKRTLERAILLNSPLVHVLRLVDGEKKAPMGYIYEAMNRAKDTIVRSFNENEEKYKEIFNIIDKRWEIQLHQPLHAVGYFLNPEFLYDKQEIEHDTEIMSDLYKCILSLIRVPIKQEKVVAEVSLYTNARGLFGNELVVRTRKTRALAYEFLQIHSKRRNRLDHQRLNDLVCINYNQALKRRYNKHNTIDPIYLKDIDDSNEWLIGRMEDEDSHGGVQDDFLFDDDNLTWGDVSRATRAKEARFDTRARARASSSIIPPKKGIASSSRTLPSHSLIDEDEDGDMVDLADGEDGEGYKFDDGNDDDDDFVDLEKE